MDRLDMIKMFVRVVESGNFSAVAREHGIGQPTVSKQIAALESHLGAQVPHWLCARELEAGALRRILRKYEPDPIPISAVRPANRRPATKVTVFIDFLVETLTTLRETR